jgi:hypothetical protein
MAQAARSLDENDPYAELRKRVIAPYSEPTAGATTNDQTLQAAPFGDPPNRGEQTTPVQTNVGTPEPVRAIGPTDYVSDSKPPVLPSFKTVASTPYTGPAYTTNMTIGELPGAEPTTAPPPPEPPPTEGGGEPTPPPPPPPTEGGSSTTPTTLPTIGQQPGATPPGGQPSTTPPQGVGTHPPGTPYSQQEVSMIVNQWMTGNNPYHHADANYWINKIMTANGGPTLDNINYFLGRFLEDPNNNPHGPQNQPGGGGQGGGGNAGAPSAPGYQEPAWMAQMRALLQQQLAGAMAPVDPNDPNIMAAVNAAKDQSTRAQDAERAALAEHLYASGAQSGAGVDQQQIGQQIQQSRERMGTQLGTMKAGLVINEINSRRDLAKNLLQMALASGDSEAARQLQWQIAQLNQMLAEEQMALQAEEFSANLDNQQMGL